MDGHSDYVAESADWLAEAEDQRDGQPLSLHLPLHLARKVSKPRRLPARWEQFSARPCARTAGIFKPWVGPRKADGNYTYPVFLPRETLCL